MKNITIKDIARELGIAVSTVSRAFNDKYDIRKETKAMILQKAKEMGYRPNPIAKRLIQQKSYTIGVVIPEFINSFFPEVIIGIQNILVKAGYQVLITQSNENAQTEKDNVMSLDSNMVDGMVISLTKETEDMSIYQELLDRGLPMVFFNRINSSLKVSKVIFDDFKWALFATEHLILQGYKKIYHLSGPTGHQNLEVSIKRIKGFKRAMEKYGLNCPPNYIIETGFYREKAEKVVQLLIDQNNLPEAFFCVNDDIAVGTMKSLKSNGYRIPDDVGIVGFSESKMVDIVDPPLTSVLQPTYEMGEKVAQLLLKQINADQPLPPETIVLNGKLNIRGSSQKKE